MISQYAMTVDVSLCIGCNSCIVACKQENGITNGSGWLQVWRKELFRGHLNRYYNPQSCRHCVEPDCVAVCPVGAIYRSEDGLVIHSVERCIGCQVCVATCPHGGMKIMANGKVGKCSLCSHLIQRGKEPACVTVCPVNARAFGEREVLIREAGLHMTNLTSKGISAHLEGTEKKQQTTVLYLLHNTADSDCG